MFSRLFYDSRFYPKKFSKTRLFIGFLISISSVFILYSFFYLLDEAFKIIDLSFTNLPFTVSEEEKYKSNLLYAGISVIIGHSIFVSYLFSRPTSALHRRSLNRKKIINEQVFLAGNFTHWFLKIGVTFGVFSSCCINFKGLVFFYPLIILMLIVLYLELWKTLLRVLPKSKYKILFGHLVITVISIFALVKFNVTDYKKIEEGVLKNNPVVNLPFSDYNKKINYVYRPSVITVKLKCNDSDELEFFTDDRGRYNISEFQGFINQERNSIREELLSVFTVRILADRNLKLHYIKDFEAKLFLSNISRVYYEAIDTSIPYLKFGTESKSINHRITPDVINIYQERHNILLPPFPPDIPSLPIFPKERFNDSLLVNVNKDVKINGVYIPQKTLKQKFKNSINSKTYFKFIYNQNTTYQDYINVLSDYYMSIYELRKSEQIIFEEYPNFLKYNSPEQKAYKAEQLKLKYKYPMVLREEYKKTANE